MQRTYLGQNKRIYDWKGDEPAREFAIKNLKIKEFLEGVGEPRFWAIVGGQGSGKTSLGVVKCLERIAMGCTGTIVADSFPRLRKVLWPGFREWCDPAWVLEKQRYRLERDWDPGSAFELTFPTPYGVSQLYFQASSSSIRGPNVNFAYFDEPDVFNADAFKAMNGDARVVGPNGEQPQIWLSTEQLQMNWAYPGSKLPGRPTPKVGRIDLGGSICE